jgi:hypothetical protein
MTVATAPAMWRRKHTRNSDLPLKERVTLYKAYMDAGLSKSQIATEMGVSKAQVTHLSKLAEVPLQIREAIDVWDRKMKYGLPWTAWREMSRMPVDFQLKQLASGRVTTPEIREDVRAYLQRKQ